MKRSEEMNGKGWAVGVLLSFLGTLCPVLAPYAGFMLVLCFACFVLCQC